jgi:hypothetical protein
MNTAISVIVARMAAAKSWAYMERSGRDDTVGCAPAADAMPGTDK